MGEHGTTNTITKIALMSEQCYFRYWYGQEQLVRDKVSRRAAALDRYLEGGIGVPWTTPRLHAPSPIVCDPVLVETPRYGGRSGACMVLLLQWWMCAGSPLAPAPRSLLRCSARRCVGVPCGREGGVHYWSGCGTEGFRCVPCVDAVLTLAHPPHAAFAVCGAPLRTHSV